MTSERGTRTRAELVAASKHVLYEYGMLKYCGDQLVPPNKYNLNTEEYIVLMESFLIHARNLDHFFHAKQYNYRLIDDDVIAEDFFEDHTWNKPSGTNLTKEERNRIHKLLAHISYKREELTSDSGRDRWPFEDIQDRLRWMVRGFAEEAPEDNLCPEWNNNTLDLFSTLY